MKKYMTPGLVLILAGIYFLLQAIPGLNVPSGLLLVLAGVGLLIGRIATHRYGLSIAGFITLCLGAGFTFSDLMNLPNSYFLIVTPLALSLAFFLVHIFEFRRTGNWPMIPALILLCFGGLFMMLLIPAVAALVKPYLGMIIPAVLIVIGVCLLIRGGLHGRAQKRSSAQQAQSNARAEATQTDPTTWAQPPITPNSAPEEEAQTEPETVVTDSIPNDAASVPTEDENTNKEDKAL